MEIRSPVFCPQEQCTWIEVHCIVLVYILLDLNRNSTPNVNFRHTKEFGLCDTYLKDDSAFMGHTHLEIQSV